MRALMGLIKDRHGTYYARHKVPERLQAVVARILDNGKARQVWLKKSLGTKVVAQANVRAKPVQMEFDRILAQAEAQLKKRPLRTSLSDIEIKRIADFFYAHELAGDDELRMDGRGDDPMYASIHEQLTDAGIEFDARYDLKALTLEPGRGLSPRIMEKIREDTEFVLAATQDALARGGHRDATMVLVAYRHGFRPAELVDLHWDQIDFSSGALHVRRVKRGTPSTHPIIGDELRISCEYLSRNPCLQCGQFRRASLFRFVRSARRPF